MDTDEARHTAGVHALAPAPMRYAVPPEGLPGSRGRAILMPTTATLSEPGGPCLSLSPVDPAWVGVLANIVLRIRAEAHHVY